MPPLTASLVLGVVVPIPTWLAVLMKIVEVPVIVFVPEKYATCPVVPVKLEAVRQTPLIAKHPPVILIPLAKVDVAEVLVTFSAVVCTPPVKVEVAGEPKVAAPVVPLKASAAVVEVAL